ncbi:MAG: PAS domain S-box protein [bacterium]
MTDPLSGIEARPRPRRRGPSLRVALILLAVGALVYVSVVGLILVVNVGPAASNVQEHSREVVTEYRESERRLAGLDSAQLGITRLLARARRRDVATSELEVLRVRLQDMEESAHTLERLALKAGPASELRTVLANGVQSESRFRTSLLGAIAATELGEFDRAAQFLQRADEQSLPVRSVLGEATAAAFREVNAQEMALAATTQHSATLVGFWLVAGVLASVFFIVFMRRRLYAPLAALDDGISRIAVGDLDVELNAPVDDELGRISDHFNRMTDMLRQRASAEEERSANESAARTRAILEAAMDAVVVVDGNGIICEWSPSADTTFGWARSEVLGRPIAECIIPEESREAMEAEFTKYRLRGTSKMIGRRIETVAIRRDGTRLQVEIAINSLNRSGRTEFSAFMRDVTDQRRLESELRQSQKMDALGRLAGGVAHDFNNLLTGISGYAELVQRDEEATQQIKEDAAAIMATAERGAELARNMLTLARHSHGRTEAVDIDTIVRDLADLFARTVDKRIVISLHLGVPAPVVAGDRSQIGNAILNLALNARDAMPEGGRLSFTTRIVQLDEAFCQRHERAIPGEYVALVVRDTGAGMSEAVRSRIFEPFFTTKRTGEGTGLGLAMVYGMVRTHQGIIDVDTAPGEGTAFTIHFPVDRSLRQADSERSRVVRTGQGRVLLVDDEDAVRDVAARMLRKAGYEVETAVDGQEAVDLVRADPGRCDIVVMDGNMPRMTGHDAARIIRVVRPDLPLVLCTGYFDARAEEMVAQDVFNSAIAKPYDMASLTKILAAQLAASTSPAPTP